MTDRAQRGGLWATVVTTGVLGTVIVGGTLAVDRPEPGAVAPAITAEYGERLIRDTAALLGPDHPDPEMRYSGTRMACASCHLDTGKEPGTLTLRLASTKYPDFSHREGTERDLQARINGCMQRSMNGRALPRDGVEILAMVAYIDGLGAEYAAMGESRRTSAEQPNFSEPDRRADVEAGRVVFESRCAVCHGADGGGLLASSDPLDGYLFPPLWGPDSYNNGAGMTRVLTAARFIKARMPFGEADLTDDEAFDVAAFVNSHPRPVKANLEQDWPDKTRKRIDSPYPPYADPFPQDQHQFGPFAPIKEYYDKLRASGTPAGGGSR